MAAISDADLALVRRIARAVHRRLPPSFDLDDLIGAGNLALIPIAAAYNPDAYGGAPFEAFARQRIRGAMLDSVRRRHWIASTHLPLEGAPDRWYSPGLDVTLDSAARSARVVAAARALKPVERAILGAHYGTGEIPKPRIAVSLGIPYAEVLAHHNAALDELRRRLSVVPSPRLAPITLTPAMRAALAAAALKQSAEVDELGALEKEFAPLRPKLARIELLRASVRARFDASPAAETFEAAGARFVVVVGARANQSTIDIAKLVKAIGAKAFTVFARATLTDLEKHVDCGVRADVVTMAQTGARSLKTFERGAPELPKAA